MPKCDLQVAFLLCALCVGFPLAASVLVAQVPRDNVVGGLAGLWKAPEYKVALASDLDISVSGRNVSRVRNVEVAIEPDGDGTLKVFTSVVDARGKTKPYSASVIEAPLTIRPPQEPGAERADLLVIVRSAEERFLDGSGDKWPIEGLSVKLSPVASDRSRVYFRFDTRQGTGSFGETLIRHGRPPASRKQGSLMLIPSEI